jgi:hypothetical protein
MSDLLESSLDFPNLTNTTDEIVQQLLEMQKTERIRALVDKACQNIAKDYVETLEDVSILEGKLMLRIRDHTEWVKNNHFIFKSRANKENHWKYLHNLVYNCMFFTSYLKYKITGKGDEEHIRIIDSGNGPKYYRDRYKIKQKNYFEVCPEFLAHKDASVELTEHGTYAIYLFGAMDKKNNRSKVETYAVIVGSLVISVCAGGIIMYSTFDDEPKVNILPYKNHGEFWYYLFSIISDPVNGPLAYARLMYTSEKYDEMKEKGECSQFDHVVLMQYCKLGDDPFPLPWMHRIGELYGVL